MTAISELQGYLTELIVTKYGYLVNKFDKSEMEAMSKMFSQMLSDAGDAYGGTSEVGGLIDRRS